MDSQIVQILRSPGGLDTLNLLEEGQGQRVKSKLIGTGSRKEFPIYQGIPVLVNDPGTDTDRESGFYDFIAPIYDLLHKTQAVRSGGESKIRNQFLQELEIKENDKVLEVSVGTGANLVHLPKCGEYFGVDISFKMLNRCKQRMEKEKINAHLVLGDAMELPFASDVFDTVFSVCALRLYGDKTRAVNEMVRVAKPGATVMIVDQRRTGVPYECIPAGMTQVNAEEFTAWDLYRLTFTKPNNRRTKDKTGW